MLVTFKTAVRELFGWLGATISSTTRVGNRQFVRANNETLSRPKTGESFHTHDCDALSVQDCSQCFRNRFFLVYPSTWVHAAIYVRHSTGVWPKKQLCRSTNASGHEVRSKLHGMSKFGTLVSDPDQLVREKALSWETPNEILGLGCCCENWNALLRLALHKLSFVTVLKYDSGQNMLQLVLPARHGKLRFCRKVVE